VKGTLLLAAKIAVSLALLAYLFLTIDTADFIRRVRTADTLLLAAAVLLYVAMLALSAWRWRRLLEAQGFPVPLRRLTSSYLVASFFNNFLPSNIGGDVIRVRDSARLTGTNTTTSLAVIAIDRILGFGALYVLAVLAFVLGGSGVRHLAGARVVLLGLFLVFSTLAYVFFRPGSATRLMAWSGLDGHHWARVPFETVQAAVHVYRERMRVVWLAFGASLALQASAVLYYYAIAHALRIPLPLSACFLMVPLCTLLQAVPVSFNGWGLRESLFALYFAQVGLSRESALAFSIVGAGLMVVLSLSGAVVWASRGSPVTEAGRSGVPE
jgi:glycosyltransferase 2 family protein